MEHAGEIDLTNGGALSNLIQVVSDTLLGSIDLLQDLLFAYSPALRADRERIEATAYDEEAMTALIEVLKLAYPFGVVLSLVEWGDEEADHVELALREWGVWDATLGQPAEIADVLTVAWLRRKRFEAQLQAVEIVNMLGQAMSESETPPRAAVHRRARAGMMP